VKSPRRVNLPSFGLPPGFEDVNDDSLFEFEPPKPKKTHRGTRGRNNRPSRQRMNLRRKAEFRLRVLRIKQQQFEAQYFRLRAAEIARDVEQDKKWLKEFAEREAARELAEAEMKRVRDWFAAELAKESRRK
jgi:hypothetical protein